MCACCRVPTFPSTSTPSGCSSSDLPCPVRRLKSSRVFTSCKYVLCAAYLQVCALYVLCVPSLVSVPSPCGQHTLLHALARSCFSFLNCDRHCDRHGKCHILCASQGWGNIAVLLFVLTLQTRTMRARPYNYHVRVRVGTHAHVCCCHASA